MDLGELNRLDAHIWLMNSHREFIKWGLHASTDRNVKVIFHEKAKHVYKAKVLIAKS
jgi:hypothetical protein